MAVLKQVRPAAEVSVEGELSPFEHEAIYQLLKKRFAVSQPNYVELPDDNLVTRVTIIFHHSYDSTFFTEVFQEGWRDLKAVLREVRHRRGRAGAAFNLIFKYDKTQLVFRLGLLGSEETASAFDQIGHLTGIVKRIMDSWSLSEPIARIECVFDARSDRWQNYQAYVESDKRVFKFDDSNFTWTTIA